MKSLLIAFVLLLTTFTLPQITFAQSMSIYSGKCTQYRKKIEGNKMKFTPVKTGWAKIVIDRRGKKFNLYFDGKLVLSRSNYMSYVDTEQGGEGFSFDNGADAHSYHAERLFQVNIEMGMGDPGYQYEIENYKVN